MSQVNTDNAPSNDEGLEDEWMIRACSVYEDEYSDCRSVKSRFHQYFVHGKALDCTQWKHDCDNCYKWLNRKDFKAAKELIDSEKTRRLERLRGHYANNVWVKRKSPPEDWSKPLPEFIQKDYEHSYLNLKAKEMKDGIKTTEAAPFCAIM